MFADSESFISSRLVFRVSPPLTSPFFSDFCSSAVQMAPLHFCSDLPRSLLLAADIYLIITRRAKVTRRLALSNTHSWSPKGPETTFPHLWMSADLSCYFSLLVSLHRRWFHPALKITLTWRPSVGFYWTFCAKTGEHHCPTWSGRAKSSQLQEVLSFCFITSCFVVSAQNVALLSTSFSRDASLIYHPH